MRATLYLLFPAAVAVSAGLLMPFNDGYFDYMVNYDPQGNDQLLEKFYTDGVFRYTSGFLCGQFLSLLFGAVLAIRGRSAPDPRRAPKTRLMAAVGGGALLALVNLAVTIPLARMPQHRSHSAAEVAAAGMSFNPDLLHDPGLRRTIAVVLAAYPLFAAAGVGLGLLLGRWNRLVLFALVWWIVLIIGGWFVSELVVHPAIAFVGLALALPLGGFATIAWTASSQYAWATPTHTPDSYAEVAAAAMLVGGLLYAVVLGWLGTVLLRYRVPEAGRDMGGRGWTPST